MNILNNIHAESLLIRTFLVPNPNSVLADFTVKVPVHRLYGPDPEFVQYSPFESGYNITATLTTCADLRYIADRHLLAEIVIIQGDGSPVQLGSFEGFQLVGVIPPTSPDTALYVYTFKTAKPNIRPYTKRVFQQSQNQ